MRTVIVAALALIFTMSAAGADVLYPNALTISPAYISGPPLGFPWEGSLPNPGDPITIRGMATAGAPFTDLLPVGPYELTLVIDGGTCFEAGVWDDFVCLAGGAFGAYQNLTLSLYLDTTPDANFASAGTFEDGELVLRAEMSGIYVTNDDPGFPPCEDRPDVFAGFVFTGGSWFSRVSSNGTGLTGNFEGEINYPDDTPIPLQILGYVLHVDGSISVQSPVAVEPATWGRVKSLYR